MPGFYDEDGNLVEVATSMGDPSEMKNNVAASVDVARISPAIAPPSSTDTRTRGIVAAILTMTALFLLVLFGAIGIGLLFRH